MPLKKRAKRDDPILKIPVPTNVKTPKVSNATKRKVAKAAKATKEPPKPSAADQKWEVMFQALSTYATANGPNWNGNVPTNYVVPQSELKLGRWVNNQRSAFHRGTLKPHRSDRLMATGLKWNVLPANAWSMMFDELKRYVDTIQADGATTWNGNVPTHYQVPGSNNCEDKNLGRWINRQRCAYSAGTLKPERQAALEAIGLKWSMMTSAVAPWDTMYQALCDHVQQQGAQWNGIVPLQYKTAGDKPLGKWVARQCKAMELQRLTPEQTKMLQDLGLKSGAETTGGGAVVVKESTGAAAIVEKVCQEAIESCTAPDIVGSKEALLESDKGNNENKMMALPEQVPSSASLPKDCGETENCEDPDEGNEVTQAAMV